MKIDPLLYRFGFVCVAASEPPSGDLWEALQSEWKPTRIGDLLILVHPEAPITPIFGSTLLIGHAFSMGDDRSVQELLEAAIVAESDAALHEALDILSGRFALITSQGGGRVYHDAVGSRTVFYRLVEPLCIASHGGLIAELFGDGVDPLADAVRREPEYATRGVVYLPGDLSVHNGVRALVPNNFYDISAGRTVRYWPRASLKKTTLDQFHSSADTYFESFVAFLANRLTPVLGVTPGVDSRMIIAAFRHHNLPMKYVTWTDQAMPKHELPLAEQMASYLGGEHIFMRAARRVEDSEDFRRIGDLAARNAGHFRESSRPTANMHQAYEGQRDLVFIRGYGGEIIRGFYNTFRKPIEALSAEELARAYSTRLLFSSPSEKYIKLVSEAVEQFMLRANYDEGLAEYGYDVNDLYYWEHRMGMWGNAMHNEMDPAMLSMTGFNSRPLFESAFGLEPSERLNKGILLDLTRRYDEGLATIPLAPQDRKRQAGGARQNANASSSNQTQLTRNKALEKELRKKEAQLDKLRARYRTTAQERNRLQRLYREIAQSRSWRYTQLLRRLVGGIKRMLEGWKGGR